MIYGELSPTQPWHFTFGDIESSKEIIRLSINVLNLNPELTLEG